MEQTYGGRRLAPPHTEQQTTPTSPLGVKHPVSATRHGTGSTVATTTIHPSGDLATTDSILDYGRTSVTFVGGFLSLTLRSCLDPFRLDPGI